jgi:hypothetical protein
MAALCADATNTLLSADLSYQRLLEYESTFAHRYRMAQPQPRAAAPVQPSCRLTAESFPESVHVGPAQVDALNALLAAHTRVAVRAAHNRPATELFGTSPYVALGRGTLRNIDASNALHYPNPVTRRVGRRIGEVQQDRFEFVDAKPVVDADRAGRSTRAGPQYAQPR